MAKGYTQQEGRDFLDTFFLIAKLTIIRLMLSLASLKKFLHQLDMDNAFLHRDLNEKVYMKSPLGLNVYEKGQVCRLTKSLYSLK